MNVSIEIHEPFPEYAWPQVWDWTRDFAQRMEDDFGPKTLNDFVDHSMALAERSRTWGVWRGAELGGLMVLEPLSPVVGLAHLIFKRSFWGRNTTDGAVREACDSVFGDGKILKICGMVFEDNNAVRAMYRRIGFHEEGKLRGQTLRGGKPVTVVACGLTKEMWNELNSRTRSAPRSDEQLEKQSDNDERNGAVVHAGAVGSPGPTGSDAILGAD